MTTIKEMKHSPNVVLISERKKNKGDGVNTKTKKILPCIDRIWECQSAVNLVKRKSVMVGSKGLD